MIYSATSRETMHFSFGLFNYVKKYFNNFKTVHSNYLTFEKSPFDIIGLDLKNSWKKTLSSTVHREVEKLTKFWQNFFKASFLHK